MEINHRLQISHISFKKLECVSVCVCDIFFLCTGTGLGGLLGVIGGGMVVRLLVGMVVRVPPPPLCVLSPLSVCSPFWLSQEFQVGFRCCKKES